MKRKKLLNSRERGFSMIEMMLVLVILSIVVGGIFYANGSGQQRAYTERTGWTACRKRGTSSTSSFRDINEIGYPNVRMMDVTSPSWVPALSTPRLTPGTTPMPMTTEMAIGLVKIDKTPRSSSRRIPRGWQRAKRAVQNQR